MAQDITGKNLADYLTKGLVVVDLWADWCGPCKILSPILEDLAQELPLTVLKVDVAQDKRLAESFGVQSIPTMLVYKAGQPYEKITGAYPKAKLKAHFQEVLAK